MWKIIKSNDDESVNFIQNYKNGILECRYVRRVDDYFIVYLSSHSGCNKSCRFCHLTATAQTSYDSSTFNEYIDQANVVLDYYQSLGNPAERVHFNFMARGEPLDNDCFVNGSGPELISTLYDISKKINLEGTSRVSTIMPSTIYKPLKNYIGLDHVIPYYSLYSVNENFRKKWIPKSLPVKEALFLLKQWQQESNQPVVIHGAFIENENDTEKDMNDICDLLIDNKLTCKMNIVRYNPFDENKHGKETSMEVLEKMKNIFISRMSSEKLLYKNTRIVPRVGFDVKASCGMFV